LSKLEKNLKNIGVKMFKVLDEACEPKRATEYSACVDLFAREDVVIGEGETKIIPLGVKIDFEKLKIISDRDLENLAGMPLDAIDNGDGDADAVYFDVFMSSHYLALFIRLSLAVKGLIIPNGQGVIDLDYPDEIGLIVHNPLTFKSLMKWIYSFGVVDRYKISKGDKVAQCTIKPHKGYLMGCESDVVRNGGFGSTGAAK
jgi:dUTPase